MDRRLTPARNTCGMGPCDGRWIRCRERVSRMSNLLRTRVEIKQQQNSEALLAAMNERQDAAEAAIDGRRSLCRRDYLLHRRPHQLSRQGAQALGWPLSPEKAVHIAIPLVAVSVWWSIRRSCTTG